MARKKKPEPIVEETVEVDDAIPEPKPHSTCYDLGRCKVLWQGKDWRLLDTGNSSGDIVFQNYHRPARQWINTNVIPREVAIECSRYL